MTHYPLSWGLYRRLLIGFLFTASFLAWRDKDRELGLVRMEPLVTFSVPEPIERGLRLFVVSNVIRKPLSVQIVTDQPLETCDLRIPNFFADPHEYGAPDPSLVGCQKNVMSGIQPGAPWEISLRGDKPFQVLRAQVVPPPY